MTVAFGVDLGGTNLRVAEVDTRTGQLHGGEVKLALPATDPDSVVDALAGALARLVETGGPEAARAPIGIGVAGMLRGDAGSHLVISNAPNLGWRDVDLGARVSAKLPGHAVSLHNDVDAIAFGEYRFGAGVGVADVLCVYAGTGIGGGLVAGGRLVTGASHVAGEIGHVKVAFGPDARACGCGARGCVEAYGGGRLLAARVREELAAGARSSALAHAGGELARVHAGHVDQAAREGDPYAVRLWDEIAPLLGSAIANAVTLLNPARVIVGGGVLWGAVDLRRRVLAAYQVFVNAPAGAACAITEAALGDVAGILGAAALAAGADAA